MHTIDLTRDGDYTALHDKLDKPMPWIGLYIAIASFVCSLAMAADASTGFRRKTFWFPCKYFTLNAFSLTLLAATMKLPLDLTSFMIQEFDKLARISSLVFMSTVMANFMTSLGSMTSNEIILNLAALVLLVLTVFENVALHIMHLLYFYDVHRIMEEQIVCALFMLLLLLILCFSAVMLPTAKTHIDLAYSEMHRKFSKDKQAVLGSSSFNELKIAVTKYWVMAETGSSQFVIARSATCVASGLMCLLMCIMLFQVERRKFTYEGKVSSNYKWSIKLILLVQTIGVALGAIAPVMRWFVAAQFKSSEIGHKSLKEELKVEAYWTQRLVYWRDRPVPLQVGSHKLKKLVYDAKRLLLNLCIGFQKGIVRASKLVLLVSDSCVKGLLFCYYHIKNLKACCYNSEESADVESRPETELDYRGYVLLLEGESELPHKTLRNICNELDKLIKKGREKKPKNLIKLLKKSTNFNGVREFDTNEVPILQHSQEPPNCWSLPVVTLTSIAISLPKTTDDMRNELLSAVSEGLYFAKLIEKAFEMNGDLTSILHAADVVWVGVEFSKKWQDKDLLSPSVQGGSNNETLQNLSNIAKEIVTECTKRNDPLMQNSLNWPFKVIAARSMYRITQTILLTRTNNDGKMDDHQKLFKRLSVMISDILAACLTNLASVITLKCHNNAVEEREDSVRKAAILLGQSEDILKIEKHELPRLDPTKAANIEEWRRALIELNPAASISASSSGTAN